MEQFFYGIPNQWELKCCDKLIKDASKRGYIFSLFYTNEIEPRRVCLNCGGLVVPVECAINCECPYYIMNKERKLSKNIMYFVHELFLQQNCKVKISQWDKVIFEKSLEDEQKQKEKAQQVKLFRNNRESGAFSIYVKDSSLTKLALFLEKIVHETLLTC